MALFLRVFEEAVQVAPKNAYTSLDVIKRNRSSKDKNRKEPRQTSWLNVSKEHDSEKGTWFLVENPVGLKIIEYNDASFSVDDGLGQAFVAADTSMSSNGTTTTPAQRSLPWKREIRSLPTDPTGINRT